MKKISPSLFLLIIICLFLPFVTISCSGQELASLSGMNLAFGTRVNSQQIDPNPLLIIVLILAIVGIALYFWKNRKSLFAAAATGVLGAILTIAARLTMDSKIEEQSHGVAETSYGAGFWLPLLLFFGAAGFNVWLYFTGNSTNINNSGEGTSRLAGSSEVAFCPQCGAKTPSGSFCNQCGAKI